MTKTLLVVLALAGLCLGILGVWHFDSSPLAPVTIGMENDRSRNVAERSGMASIQRVRDVSALSSATGRNSTANAPVGSSTRVASSSRAAQASRLERPGSEFPFDGEGEGLAISGLVQDEDGLPLANIEVLAEAIHLSDADTSTGVPSLEAERSSWTKYDGSFFFRGLGDGEYRIRVTPVTGFAPAETTARAGVMSANLVLVQQREIRLYGIVESTEGDSLGDVRVIAGPPTRVANTSLNGDYDLDISMMGKNRPLTIHFRHEGYRDQSVRLDPAELEDQFDFQLDVSMEPLKGLTNVTGRLVDSEGRPVAGKIINLRSPKLQNSYRVQSDARGDFFMTGVEPGKDYRLAVRPGAAYRDYEKARLEIPAGGLQLDIILEPLAQGELSGFITDVGGRPIPGFALTLHSKVAAGRTVQVVGDNTGFFTVEGFPEGSAVLKTNSYPAFETQGIRLSPEAEEPVSVILDVGSHAVFGRVTTVFGDTVAGPEVSLGWQHRENSVQNYSMRRTTADQNGDFVFTGLGSGEHTIRVNAPGFSMAVVKIDVGMNPDNIVVELTEES